MASIQWWIPGVLEHMSQHLDQGWEEIQSDFLEKVRSKVRFKYKHKLIRRERDNLFSFNYEGSETWKEFEHKMHTGGS